MFVAKSSRYNLADVIIEEDGGMHFGMRDRLLWQDLAGVLSHIVIEGETLWTIAAKYYGSTPGSPGSELWWVLADFQPEPMNDPTISLSPGQTLLIPPKEAVLSALAGIMNETLMETET